MRQSMKSFARDKSASARDERHCKDADLRQMSKGEGSVRVIGRVVLRVVDGDRGGGLTAVKMVKYTAKG